ncbi:hypothetical protein [Streptomyces meridianus]|uniref:Uncharacterized protein n=1 Tax=Streptomyces meridianus TaxID=2938945 RepID=A0ABT0XF78_9ACTN|nr:hypothetical protein [Streptomyces meridianus]MCM2580474.1 hypothetical protein [Streptomyces meridianus]
MSECGLCEREVHGEATCHLCPGCTRVTSERLTRMPEVYDALAAFLQPGGRRPELGRATRVDAPLPIVEPVLNLRGPGGIVGVLEDWRSALHADLEWSEPQLSGTVPDRIARASKGLRDNLLWIASSWPMAGAFAEEIRDLERDAVSIVNPPEKALRLGNCPAVYEDGVPCGAVLRVPAGTARVECRWCHTVYPPATWSALASGQWADERKAS